MFGKCIKDKYLAGGITKLLNESEGMKGWKWSAKNFSQNLFGRVLLGDLQWRVEIDWAQGFFAKCFWSSFLFSFSSVTCTTCLHRQRIQSSAFTDWKFKKRNTIYLTALRSGEWKKHNAQMCFVSFLIQLFLALNLCHSMTLPDVYMIFGVIRGVANGAVLPGRVFRIFGRLVFHVLTAPVFQTGWKQAEGHFLSISIFQSFSNSIKFVIQFSSS